MDTADVIFPILDTAGNISGYDTVAMPQKPLSPQTGFEPEKYYGHVSLKDGSDPVLTIERYTAINDKTGEPSGSLVQKDVYQRPEQDTE
jgi:hypothetical protein